MSQVVSVVLALAGLVVALALLIKDARGRARVTGIIGAVFLALSMISGPAYRWFVDPILAHAEDATLLSAFAAETLLGSILTGAGLLLITYAIIVSSRFPKTRRTPASVKRTVG